MIEEDAETVLELNDDGVETILGDLEDESTFAAANVGQARAIVVDISDERNVATILTARETREDVTVIGVAEDDETAIYQRYAGADRVVQPREALGRRLGNRAVLGFEDELQSTIELGNDLELTELRIPEDSDLVGQTIGEANLGEEYGITIAGIWFGGQFVPAPGPHVELEANALLVVTGAHEELEAIATRTVSAIDRERDHVVVAGSGVVGRSVVEVLETAEVPHTVVDETDGELVDVVGPMTDPETLSAADVGAARFVVLALDDDTATMYTTVMLERLAPDASVFARANDTKHDQALPGRSRGRAHPILGNRPVDRLDDPGGSGGTPGRVCVRGRSDRGPGARGADDRRGRRQEPNRRDDHRRRARRRGDNGDRPVVYDPGGRRTRRSRRHCGDQQVRSDHTGVKESSSPTVS